MNKLVLNKKETILKFAINLLPSQCRFESLEGQEYTVVPMVILTEGVHNGSMGPLLYPKAELSKTPVVWNHKPIVVYHPTMNGVGVSACDPDIINSRKVGLMMNTKFEKGKLKSEAWIRKDRADTVDERIMSAVTNSEMMELSTGVFVDVEEKEGEFDGESYVGIARNYRPDHLALLPDQIGACSIEDGAGFLRNAAAKRNIPQEVLHEALRKLGLAGNELSHSDIYGVLAGLLRTKFGETPMVWVADVFSNFVVYERDGKFFRLGYTSNDTQVQLSDETPVEVVKVSEYRTVQNTTATDEQTIMNPEIKKLVDIIVGNAKWSDEDREKLGKVPKERLEALAEVKKANPNFSFSMSTPEAPATNAKVEKPEAPAASVTAPVVKTEPVTNQQSKVLTVNDYVGAAPREIQEVLTNGIQIYNEEKDKIVATILANESNPYTEADLKTRPLGELRKMVQLMGNKTTTERAPSYAGQAPTPAANAEKEEPLEVPAMNFGK